MSIEIATDARIYVAGHAGLVGSAIVRRLEAEGFTNILTASRTSSTCATRPRSTTGSGANRPEYVFLVAGTVGGILANSTRPAEFIYDNMMIHATVVHASHLYGVSKLLYLGSSCIYPRQAHAADHRGRSCSPARSSRPTRRTRSPRSPASSCARPTAAQYGCDFISAMPTNLYGPNDNFDLTSQPRPAGADPQVPRRQGRRRDRGRDLGHRHAAPRVPPRRRSRRRLPLPDGRTTTSDEHINVGTGEDLAIRELAEMVRDIVHPDGRAGRSTRPSPTARPARCSTSSSCTTSAGTTASRCATASQTTYGGSSTTRSRRARPRVRRRRRLILRSGGRAGHLRLVAGPTPARRAARCNDLER